MEVSNLVTTNHFETDIGHGKLRKAEMSINKLEDNSLTENEKLNFNIHNSSKKFKSKIVLNSKVLYLFCKMIMNSYYTI